MEQDTLISDLRSGRSGKRLSTLTYLENTFSNEDTICNYELSPASIKALTVALLETEVGSTKCRCLYLLRKVLPSLRDTIDQSFSVTAPIVLGYFIYPKEPIRQLARSLWKTYVQLSKDPQLVVDYLVTHGLQSTSFLLRNSIASELIDLMPVNFELQPGLNYHSLVQSLVNLMLSKPIKFSIKRQFFGSYDQLKERIGLKQFDSILNFMSTTSDFKEFLGMSCNFNEWKRSFDIKRYHGIFPQNILYSLIHHESKTTQRRTIKKLQSYMLDEMKRELLLKNLTLSFELLLYFSVRRPPLHPSVACDLFHLLGSLVTVTKSAVEQSVDMIVACVASWIDVEDQPLQSAILQTCFLVAIVTSDELIISCFLKFLQPLQTSQRRKQILDLIIFLHLKSPSNHSISSDLDGYVDNQISGFRGKTLRSVLSCLISQSPDLKLASLECLAVLLEEIKNNEGGSYLKKVFFSTVANQLEFLMGEDFSKNDKSLVYMAISMRLSRNQLARINADNCHINYYLDPSCHVGFDVMWVCKGFPWVPKGGDGVTKGDPKVKTDVQKWLKSRILNSRIDGEKDQNKLNQVNSAGRAERSKGNESPESMLRKPMTSMKLKNMKTIKSSPQLGNKPKDKFKMDSKDLERSKTPRRDPTDARPNHGAHSSREEFCNRDNFKILKTIFADINEENTINKRKQAVAKLLDGKEIVEITGRSDSTSVQDDTTRNKKDISNKRNEINSTCAQTDLVDFESTSGRFKKYHSFFTEIGVSQNPHDMEYFDKSIEDTMTLAGKPAGFIETFRFEEEPESQDGTGSTNSRIAVSLTTSEKFDLFLSPVKLLSSTRNWLKWAKKYDKASYDKESFKTKQNFLKVIKKMKNVYLQNEESYKADNTIFKECADEDRSVSVHDYDSAKAAATSESESEKKTKICSATVSNTLTEILDLLKDDSEEPMEVDEVFEEKMEVDEVDEVEMSAIETKMMNKESQCDDLEGDEWLSYKRLLGKLVLYYAKQNEKEETNRKKIIEDASQSSCPTQKGCFDNRRDGTVMFFQSLNRTIPQLKKELSHYVVKDSGLESRLLSKSPKSIVESVNSTAKRAVKPKFDVFNHRKLKKFSRKCIKAQISRPKEKAEDAATANTTNSSNTTTTVIATNTTAITANDTTTTTTANVARQMEEKKVKPSGIPTFSVKIRTPKSQNSKMPITGAYKNINPKKQIKIKQKIKAQTSFKDDRSLQNAVILVQTINPNVLNGLNEASLLHGKVPSTHPATPDDISTGINHHHSKGLTTMTNSTRDDSEGEVVKKNKMLAQETNKIDVRASADKSINEKDIFENLQQGNQKEVGTKKEHERRFEECMKEIENKQCRPFGLSPTPISSVERFKLSEFGRENGEGIDMNKLKNNKNQENLDEILRNDETNSSRLEGSSCFRVKNDECEGDGVKEIDLSELENQISSVILVKEKTDEKIEESMKRLVEIDYKAYEELLGNSSQIEGEAFGDCGVECKVYKEDNWEEDACCDTLESQKGGLKETGKESADVLDEEGGVSMEERSALGGQAGCMEHMREMLGLKTAFETLHNEFCFISSNKSINDVEGGSSNLNGNNNNNNNDYNNNNNNDNSYNKNNLTKNIKNNKNHKINFNFTNNVNSKNKNVNNNSINSLNNNNNNNTKSNINWEYDDYVCEKTPFKENLTENIIPVFPWKSRRNRPKKLIFEDLVDKTSPNAPVQSCDSLCVVVKNAQNELTQALSVLYSNDWEKECTALKMVSKICFSEPSVIRNQLVCVSRAVTKEVQNLRSKVCLQAIITLGHMFSVMKKNMDSEVEVSVRTLLAKSGESNKFIKEESVKCLETIEDNVSFKKSCSSLIPFGTGHKNIPIRNVSAKLLLRIVTSYGAARLLSNKELSVKLLAACLQLLLAGSQDARDNAQLMVKKLMLEKKLFQRVLLKVADEKLLNNTRDKLEHIRNMAIKDIDSSVGRDSVLTHDSYESSMVITSISSSPVLAMGADSQSSYSKELILTSQRLARVENQLKSLDAGVRMNGLVEFQGVLQDNPSWIEGVLEVLDLYFPCLSDRNPDLLTLSLKLVDPILECLRDSVLPKLHHITLKLGLLLVSGDEAIVDLVFSAFDSIMQLLDPFSVLPLLIREAKNCGIANKINFIHRVHYLFLESAAQRPVQSAMKAVPFLWHLLSYLNTDRNKRLHRLGSSINTPRISSNNEHNVEERNRETMLQNKPDLLQNKPGLLQNKPHLLENKTNLLLKKQSLLQNKPLLLGNEQHLLGNEQHMMGNEQNLLGNEQHLLGNEQHLLGNEQHLLGKQEGSLNIQRGEVHPFKGVGQNDKNSGGGLFFSRENTFENVEEIMEGVLKNIGKTKLQQEVLQHQLQQQLQKSGLQHQLQQNGLKHQLQHQLPQSDMQHQLQQNDLQHQLQHQYTSRKLINKEHLLRHQQEFSQQKQQLQLLKATLINVENFNATKHNNHHNPKLRELTLNIQQISNKTKNIIQNVTLEMTKDPTTTKESKHITQSTTEPLTSNQPTFNQPTQNNSTTNQATSIQSSNHQPPNQSANNHLANIERHFYIQIYTSTRCLATTLHKQMGEELVNVRAKELKPSLRSMLHGLLYGDRVIPSDNGYLLNDGEEDGEADGEGDGDGDDTVGGNGDEVWSGGEYRGFDDDTDKDDDGYN